MSNNASVDNEIIISKLEIIDSLDDNFAIDDTEFNIPKINKVPTLESILNSSDEDPLLQNSFHLNDGLFSNKDDKSETQSLSSQDGSVAQTTSLTNSINSNKDNHPSQTNSLNNNSSQVILRHIVLKKISSQLLSASDKVNAGLPTALAVSSSLAIGTSHGLVLVFNSKQVMRWCLGGAALGSKFGAVSSLSFNSDCTRLLCGYARGQITMWDLTNGKLLRTIEDAHPPGNALLHVKFTDDRTLALSNDSGGSVFQLEFKRPIGVRTCESKCLFSGSRGEACIIEPLNTRQSVPDHPMKDVIIVAVASLSKVIIVVIKPHLKVHFVHPLPGDPATLPLLSWQYVLIQIIDSSKVLDPVLAFARDQTLLFAQVICLSLDNIQVTILQKTSLSYKLLAMTWINSRTMVLIDTSEKAHLVDVRSEEEIQILDLAEVQLAYGTSFYKSLATGGNVSKALAYGGERACYQSIVTFNNQLVLLGTKSVHVLTIRTWKERLAVLLKYNNFKEALDLGLKFFDGSAKAVVGLSWDPVKRRTVTEESILDILGKYADFYLIRPKGFETENLKDLKDLVNVCIRTCKNLSRTDILFGDLYVRFSTSDLLKQFFLETLEDYILEDSMKVDNPFVVRDFVEYFDRKEGNKNLGLCITHFDIATIDLNQVIPLCWKYGFYDAIFYIYNEGLKDYISPFQELISRLDDRIILSNHQTLKFADSQMGNKLLVYLCCCLTGRSYSCDELLKTEAIKVKSDVLNLLTSKKTSNPHDNLSNERITYPVLNSLISFDVHEFFNVLSIAFAERILLKEEKQNLVDVLLSLMVDDRCYTSVQIGSFYTFIANQLTYHECEIMVETRSVERIFEFLCSSVEQPKQQQQSGIERQEIFLKLLETKGLDNFHISKLAEMAEIAGFYRVVELIRMKQRLYHTVLKCYLDDPSIKALIFDWSRNILRSCDLTVDEKEKIKAEIVNNLESLVAMDAEKTVQLIVDCNILKMADVCQRLSDKEAVLFQFLKGVFNHIEHQKDKNPELHEATIDIIIDSTIHEKYFELLLKFQPDSCIDAYLSKHTFSNFDNLIAISKRSNNQKSLCYLYEQSNNLPKALDIAYQILIAALSDDSNNNKGAKILDQRLDFVLGLLIRISSRLDASTRQEYWFKFLDSIIQKQQESLSDISSSSSSFLSLQSLYFQDLTNHTINSMILFIPLSIVLERLLANPAYQFRNFGNLKDLLSEMFRNCNYENNLLHACTNIVNDDLYEHLKKLYIESVKGITWSGYTCALCDVANSSESLSSSSFLYFRCNHSFHKNCLLKYGIDDADRNRGEKNGYRSKCPICYKINLPDGNKSQGVGAIERMRSNESDVPLSENGINILTTNDDQLTSFRAYKQKFKSESWLEKLGQLKRKNNNSKSVTMQQNDNLTYYQNDSISLNLAAPSHFSG